MQPSDEVLGDCTRCGAPVIENQEYTEYLSEDEQDNTLYYTHKDC